MSFRFHDILFSRSLQPHKYWFGSSPFVELQMPRNWSCFSDILLEQCTRKNKLYIKQSNSFTDNFHAKQHLLLLNVAMYRTAIQYKHPCRNKCTRFMIMMVRINTDPIKCNFTKTRSDLNCMLNKDDVFVIQNRSDCGTILGGFIDCNLRVRHDQSEGNENKWISFSSGCRVQRRYYTVHCSLELYSTVVISPTPGAPFTYTDKV